MPKCNCKLKSGEPCSYNAKSGSLYCGKHQLCQNIRSASPKRASPKRKSPKRASPKRKSPKRKSPKRASPKRASPKRKSPKIASPKRKSPKRKSPKKESPKKESPKRVSPKRVSPKRVSPKRASPKRASPKRKSPCPEGKELNPRTSRCVAKCSPNQIRNEKGRCVSPKRNQNELQKEAKKMYPICLRFYVVINDSDEIANPSTLTEDAKALFRDAIENKFVQRLEDVSLIRITDIKLTFTNDGIILMKGLIPISSKDKRLLYGATLSSWIQAIDEKGVWQIGFGPNRDDSVISNGKEYNLFSVIQCK